MNQTTNFEQAFARLEEIAAILEGGQASLDETMQYFEEANELFQFCAAKLNQAEEKLYVISKKQDAFQLEIEEKEQA
ncbi:MAG: exodeoxyribonuclease VII small subunit [Calditrichaeota bacterium]|nr:MAG: exodeoxyribonuclease VII small subunit [Calditrichota bacterium]